MTFYVVELLDDWNMDVPSWKYSRNLESPRVSSPGFGNDSKMMVIYYQMKQTQHRIRPVSSATSMTVSRQTVYRRLGHIVLYDRRPVRFVPLTATHCRLRLTWSREHALWTPQQWSCVMFSDKSRTDLYVQSITMIGHIHRDVILEQHIRLIRGAMAAEFLFMDDNARRYCANILNECPESEDITRMD
ncbi:HTH_Tnp_Tc3_2 domain-containing protein [Trichonephila clavipes]|uniref:HTH_Tnp_Tc3_2 domain-containing protein n=1 Tax=Trichonephila clavipes TaxID=2585209 RepID=A0A8X6UYP6_TRICX|nr:HTH_Tnp_Tc3_2 domain-containing protein [Trichonephila clavipes]